MINKERFLNELYKKFGSQIVIDNRETIVDIVSEENDLEICKYFIDLSDIDSKDLLVSIATALNNDGQTEKSEWIKQYVDSLPQETPQEVFFFWLNGRVKVEVLSMQLNQRKTLSSIISSIEENKELLDGNHESVGFVIQGNEFLRDIKKHGSNGFRVYYTLMPDKKSCVIIGVSKGKSSTDVPKTETEKFARIAEETQRSVDVSKLEEVNIITESITGLCVLRENVPYGIIDKLKDCDCNIKMFRRKIGADNIDAVVFFDENLLKTEVDQKQKELTESDETYYIDSDFAKWIHKRLFSDNGIEIDRFSIIGQIDF